MRKESAKVAQRWLVFFHLGSEMLALDASGVREIAPMARLSTPGGLPSVLAGFLNLGGALIPVIRLHRLLELPEAADGLYTQILIVRDRDGSHTGWIVDRVAQVIVVRDEELMEVPEGECFKDCAKGVCVFNNTNVSILDPDRVLLEKERQCIRQFRDKELERLRKLEPSEV